ncbi:hypothetical protein V6N13_047696 [Hibiscus sabdariffa]|uniref:21 kDa seed protein n=1 Tax=Hibiscus sabdariffa TaxID=183260 RepID=A0ABR2F503_9ROSI
MKTTPASLFLLFILSITQSSFPFGVANAADDAVLDANGEVVRTGVRYYVVSAIWGAGGGGLAIGRESGRPCPEIVVQRLSDTDLGIPVVFSNPKPVGDVVRPSSDVQVKFDGPRDRLCLTSTVWKLQHYDESTGKTWVELGGAEGGHVCGPLKNWFKIEKTDMDRIYKFKYCPWACGSSKTLCNEIGKAQDADGQMRLALADGPGYPWLFIRADRANEASTRIRQVVRA